MLNKVAKKEGLKASGRERQQGIVLLVALVMTVMFVLLGLLMTEKSKTNTSMVGSKVRYDVVYEAAEQSIRDSMLFIRNLRAGDPIATSDGSQGAGKVGGFDLSTIWEEGESLIFDPSYSFVWAPGALEQEVCGSDACPAGIDFSNELDSNIWRGLAVQSRPGTLNVQTDRGNHILNTRTYTFVQLIKRETVDYGSSVRLASYYLITVKASGYIPGVEPADSNARENVILQAVYIQKT